MPQDKALISVQIRGSKRDLQKTAKDIVELIHCEYIDVDAAVVVSKERKLHGWQVYEAEVWNWMCDQFALNQVFETKNLINANIPNSAWSKLSRKTREVYTLEMCRKWANEPNKHFVRVAYGKYKLPEASNGNET